MKKTIKKGDFKAAVTKRYLAAFDEIAQQQGLPDRDVCAQLNIRPQRLSEFRYSRKFPTTEEIAILCTTFKYSLSSIIFGTNKDFSKSPSNTPTNLDIYNELQEIKSLLKKK